MSSDSVLSGVDGYFGDEERKGLGKNHKHDDRDQVESIETRSRLQQLISSYLKLLGGLLSINPQSATDIAKVKSQINDLVRCANGATEEPTEHGIETTLRGTWSSLCDIGGASKAEGEKPWWESDSEEDDDEEDCGWDRRRSTLSKANARSYGCNIGSNLSRLAPRSPELSANTATTAYDADSESDVE